MQEPMRWHVGSCRFLCHAGTRFCHFASKDRERQKFGGCAVQAAWRAKNGSDWVVAEECHCIDHCCLTSESRHPSATSLLPPVIIKNGAVEKTDCIMPKMKSKSSAKKRFRVRPGGTVKCGHAFKRHILTKKTTKNKRQLRGIVNVNASDIGSVMRMLPNA